MPLPSPIPSPVPPQNAAPRSAAATWLYAFSWAGHPFVASYALPANGTVNPSTVIKGWKTGLRKLTGSYSGGIAVDGTTLYVLDRVHSELLSFPLDAHGNVSPLRVAKLPSGGYYNGFALDGHGNFWTAEWNSLTMQRFALNGRGSLKPSIAFQPVLNTPVGMKRAAVATVAMRGSDLYCLCVFLYQGRGFAGVSEYDLDSAGRHRLVKSFFDPGLPELTPNMMTVDPQSGVVYAASIGLYSGIFSWPSYQKSGIARTHNWVGGPATNAQYVDSLTTDAKGRLYVATPTGILVFPAKANGDIKPTNTIVDPKHLQYAEGDFGNYITIH